MNDSTLKENREALETRFPGLWHAAQQAQGRANLQLDEQGPEQAPVLVDRPADGPAIHFHTPHDPAQDAARRIDRLALQPDSHVFCVGFGAGYHIRAMLEALGDEGRVTVMLVQPAALSIASSVLDLRDLFADSRLRLIWGSAQKLAQELQTCISGRPVVYYHEPSLERPDPPLAPLTDAIKRFRTRRERERVGAPIVLENYRQNLDWTTAATGIDSLADIYDGYPAVIVAAGPSLDQNVEQLSAVLHVASDTDFSRARLPVFCVDTALRRLVGARMLPTFVVTSDPSYHSAQHFKNIPEDVLQKNATALLAIDLSGCSQSASRPKGYRLPQRRPSC